MYSKIEKINKLDIASSLTNQAIRMFFHKDNPISTHVIVSAANEILINLIKKNGLKTNLKSKYGRFSNESKV
ncbi:MAG TPA: hypothetical protein PLG15_02090 [Candidatus Gastranaerophilaceae bacterium]|nr:hypothetical protein [Candidatus Gastranaerophilaceae bacterium]HPT41154.1 hypothetical protein [Candidatus Gastranaerophilaceae bacterium]